MVKNESDIIESFIRYHLNIVDEILISDHNSCDSTRIILESIRDEGFPIHIFTEQAADQQQSRVMTNLMHKAVHEYNADIILPLDADEFIVPEEDGNDTRSILQNLNLDTVYTINSTIFFPHESANSDDLFFYRNFFYKSKIYQDKDKILLGKDILRKYHVSIEQGNHDIGISKRKRKKIKYSKNSQVKIVHIPYRNYNQFLSKVTVGWVSNSARHNKKANDAHHWRDAFTKIKQGNVLSINEIYKILSSTDFDKDEMEIQSLESKFPPITKKYNERISSDPFINLLHASESLAIQYSSLNKKHNKFIDLLFKIFSISFRNLKFFICRKLLGYSVSSN